MPHGEFTVTPRHVPEPRFCRPSGTSAPRYAKPVEVEQVLASDKLPHIGTFSKPSGETPRRDAIAPVRCPECCGVLKPGRTICPACSEDRRNGTLKGRKFPLRLINELEMRDVVGDYTIRYRDGRNEVLDADGEVVAEGSGNFCLNWALEATAINRKGVKHVG